MSRTGGKGKYRGLAATGFVVAALVASARLVAGPLGIVVLQRDGQPLSGAVVTAEPESLRLPAATPLHAIVDQIDLAFVPDIIVIPVGSAVSFPNSDAVSHQVYSFSNTRRFQLPLYRGKPYPPVVFDQPGLVTLGCNIHDNMLAYVMVTAAPFFGRTDANGAWSAANVPNATYRIHVWHPRLNEPDNTLEQVAEVSGAEGAQVTLQIPHALRPRALKARPHSWDY